MSDISFRSFTGTAAESYQRHFAPAIATRVAAGLHPVARLQPASGCSPDRQRGDHG